MGNSANYFDIPKVSRLIALGYPSEAIVPHFIPLINLVLNKVSYDPRNQTEEDLRQVGLLKSLDIIRTFRPEQGNLFSYATKLLQHALWAEAKKRPLDHKRTDDDVEFDQIVDPYKEVNDRTEEWLMSDKMLKHLRISPGNEKVIKYVFGVLLCNDYETNRSRVLKTLTHGFDVNLNYSRFIVDQVLVKLRMKYSKGVKTVRDDRMFNNKFQATLVPELRLLLGERAFERLMHYFGGMTVTIPSTNQIDAIDRDLAILTAMSEDWTCGPTLSKQYGISPEGVKAVYKTCLHRLHSDKEFRELVSKLIPLDKIPGYEKAGERAKPKTPVSFGERKPAPRRKLANTDSMGFTLGSRNSLMYTLIVTGKCTRADLIQAVLTKFQGRETAAKATVSAFLSDLKQPFGRFNSSRNLTIIKDSKNCLSFEMASLADAQQKMAEKRQEQLLAQTD